MFAIGPSNNIDENHCTLFEFIFILPKHKKKVDTQGIKLIKDSRENAKNDTNMRNSKCPESLGQHFTRRTIQ